MSRQEAIDAIICALNRIPEQYRQALWMVHIEGTPVRDAALKIGKTERAIHGLRRRGLKRLREELPSATKFFSSGG